MLTAVHTVTKKLGYATEVGLNPGVDNVSDTEAAGQMLK